MKNRIHLIIPMGGLGSRFSEAGFTLPKPLIEIKGKPFLYWATQSISRFVDVQDIIFIVLRQHIDEFKIDETIKLYFPDAKIVIDNSGSKGAVTSCLECIDYISDEMPLVFNDCDHLFNCKEFNNYCNSGDFNNFDGALLTFTSNDPKFSFLEFDDKGNVARTVEKVAVSNNAICGTYYFKNRTVFEENAKEYLKTCSYKEFFMSGVYNVMTSKDLIIKGFNVDMHLPFGTPEEYEEALKSNDFEMLK